VDKVYDFVIIGGGPAGSTAASNLARNGFKVLVLEKEKFPRFHVGESLLPFCYGLFKDLGVLGQMEKEFKRKPGVTFSNSDNTNSSNWCFNHLIKDDSHLSFHVERDRFDKILLERSRELGAEVLEATQVSSVDFSSNKHVKVVTKSEECFLANFLIDASGQDAFLGKLQGTKRNQPQLSQRIALSAHWEKAKLDPILKEGNLRIVSLEGRKKGWIWMIPVSDQRLSVGVVVELDYFKSKKRNEKSSSSDWLRDFYISEVNSCRLGKEVLTSAKMAMEVAVNSNYSFDVSQKYGDRFAVIGDAASFLDPMFASGVFVGMKSAMLVTNALLNINEGEYESELIDAYSQISGAYQLLELMITTFYNPDAIKFSELDHGSISEYKKLDTVFGIMHLVLAGDFFSNHKNYLKAIEVLSSAKMVERFRHLTNHTDTQTSQVCTKSMLSI